MKSYRCKRCWRSFDSKHKVEDHQEQQYPCEPKAMPTNERFMSDDHEAELEKGRQSKSEDEAWWDIFRLLIPGMQRRDIGSLMREYWPCKTSPFGDMYTQEVGGKETRITQRANKFERLYRLGSDPHHAFNNATERGASSNNAWATDSRGAVS